MARNKPRLLGYAIFLLLPLLGAPAGAEVVDRIVAVVNDQIITLSELEQAAKSFQSMAGLDQKGRDSKAFQREVLEALIDRKLAQAEAKRRGIAVADKELDQALKDFKERNHLLDEAALNQALAKAGLTLKELRQQISDQIMQEHLIQLEVGGKVTVSEADIRRFYNEHAQKGGTQVHLRLIVVPYPPGAVPGEKEATQKKAEEIVQELRQKASFTEMLRKHGVQGEDLGFISQGDLDPRLADFLKQLSPGDVGPIQTPGGFQLVQLVGRRSGQPRPFEEAAPEIRKILMQQEMEKRFADWVKTLRERAHVRIML